MLFLLGLVMLPASCAAPSGQRSPSTLPSVEALLTSSRPEDRLAGIRVLRDGNDPAAAYRLAAALRDPDARVRLAAVLAGWQREDAGSVTALTACLKDPDAEVRCAAGYALRLLDGSQAADRLAILLQDSDPAVRIHAARVLTELGDKRGPGALAAIGKEKDHLAKAALLANVRTLDSSEVVRMILHLSDDWDFDIGNEAGWLLSNRFNRTAMEVYIAALHEPAESIRARAIWCLGDSRDSGAVEPLIRSMANDESQLNREYAAEALGKIGNPSALAPVLQALGDGRIDAFPAATALGGLGKPAIPHLSRMLEGREGNDMVAVTAAEKLGEIGDPTAVPALIGALRHPYWGVRQASSKSLEKITGQKFQQDAEKWEQWARERKP